MDWITPTDEELAAMTDEEILGPEPDLDNPFAPRDREYPGDRYPVCLGSVSAAAAADLGVIVDPTPMRECWIDLKARRLHHVPGCCCIRRLT